MPVELFSDLLIQLLPLFFLISNLFLFYSFILQANVMLEYELQDAEALLTKNLSAANSALKQVSFDLDFLRDQYTTVEVSILYLKITIHLIQVIK